MGKQENDNLPQGLRNEGITLKARNTSMLAAEIQISIVNKWNGALGRPLVCQFFKESFFIQTNRA